MSHTNKSTFFFIDHCQVEHGYGHKVIAVDTGSSLYGPELRRMKPQETNLVNRWFDSSPVHKSRLVRGTKQETLRMGCLCSRSVQQRAPSV